MINQYVKFVQMTVCTILTLFAIPSFAQQKNQAPTFGMIKKDDKGLIPYVNAVCDGDVSITSKGVRCSQCPATHYDQVRAREGMVVSSAYFVKNITKITFKKDGQLYYRTEVILYFDGCGGSLADPGPATIIAYAGKKHRPIWFEKHGSFAQNCEQVSGYVLCVEEQKGASMTYLYFNLNGKIEKIMLLATYSALSVDDYYGVKKKGVRLVKKQPINIDVVSHGSPPVFRVKFKYVYSNKKEKMVDRVFEYSHKEKSYLEKGL